MSIAELLLNKISIVILTKTSLSRFIDHIPNTLPWLPVTLPPNIYPLSDRPDLVIVPTDKITIL